MTPMAPIVLVVGGAKAELAQALVLCETGAVPCNKTGGTIQAPWCCCPLAEV